MSDKISANKTTKVINFNVPVELNNDILYCQKSIRQYIKIHQILASRNNFGTYHISEVEKEIIDIGREQKHVVDRLRLCMEGYYLRLENANIVIDRPKTNAHIARQISNYLDYYYETVQPLHVKTRLNEKELYEKYVFNIAFSPSYKKEVTPEPIIKSEEIEIPISPQDISLMSTHPSIQPIKQQVSLLKPKSERVATTTASVPYKHVYQKYNNTIIEKPSTQNQAIPQNSSNSSNQQNPPKPSTKEAINNSRLNLLQALKKAKRQKQSAASVQVREKSITPPLKQLVESTPIPSSASSSASSESYNGIDLADEDTEPLVLGKEAFLRVFGLCTQTYKTYLASRRSERKRRNVTSTEKGDFHYGKLDLFERQTAKNNKRTLLSPPSTRTVKKRKQNNEIIDKKAKSEVSSSSTASKLFHEDVKTCVSCIKNSAQLLECQSCYGFFHISCHKQLIIQTLKGKDKYCPLCYRQGYRSKEAKILAQSRGKNTGSNMINKRQLQTKLCILSAYYEEKLIKEQIIKSKLELENFNLKNSIRKIMNTVNVLKA